MAAFTLVAAATAQDQAASASKKPLTPEAGLKLRTISDLEFSPDGSRLAFVVTEPAKGENRAQHIWMYEKSSGSLRQFTFSAKSETSPRWSPDSRQLAFLSNRGEQQQIYLIRTDGGEASELTTGKRSVRSFEWSPDGKQIAFLAPDAKTEAEEKKDKDKDDARVADKDEKHPRLWLASAAGGEPKAVTSPQWQISELAWLPSGDRIIVRATDHPESDEDTDRILSVSLSDGSLHPLMAPKGPFRQVRVSPDGKSVAYVGCRDDGPEPHDLMLLDLAQPAARNLTAASLDRAVIQYRWQRDGSIFLVAASGFSQSMVRFTSDGSRKDLPIADVFPGNFSLGGGGEIAVVSQAATLPQEIWLWDQKGAAREISNLNEGWKEYTLSKPQIYRYRSFDGLQIEAALLLPPGFDGKSRLPLIAWIHGGPTGRWGSAIEPTGQLLAARGYAVFYPNIRGSIGYGQKFAEMNRGDWGGADFKDVMAGVQDLIDRGVADAARLGIGGWSYGGYMAEWAITQTNIFKAAVAGAGLSNLMSEFGTEQHPSYDEWFYGAPYDMEKAAGFLKSSPVVYLKNAKTPTLILQGDADTTDPPGQSQELYRGLKHYGVEAELVMYPREPHGLREEKHLLDRLNRILAWYDKHLGNPSAATGH
jgi:dipeptidyl aminopeptidase/acylaminoacyl peptidase